METVPICIVPEHAALQQTSSIITCILNKFAGSFCWTFAGSCKHPISQTEWWETEARVWPLEGHLDFKKVRTSCIMHVSGYMLSCAYLNLKIIWYFIGPHVLAKSSNFYNFHTFFCCTLNFRAKEKTEHKTGMHGMMPSTANSWQRFLSAAKYRKNTNFLKSCLIIELVDVLL